MQMDLPDKKSEGPQYIVAITVVVVDYDCVCQSQRVAVGREQPESRNFKMPAAREKLYRYNSCVPFPLPCFAMR